MSDPRPASAAPLPTAPATEHDALPAGTRFAEFEILRVLGVGGFGIVYLAFDHSLEREVALKEYMPASLAARGDGPQITVRSSSFQETYALGLRSFVNEARLLARFDHPSLLKVYRFWEDNGTAYMVMPHLQGTTLRDTRRSMPYPPDEAWVRRVMAPLLGALDLLHREGVYHRDIAPDNILIPFAGPPVLLDFGAARRIISDRTQSLTAILKPSYAPIEQYADMPQLRQGPWTDLYALGAVIHYVLLGVPPSPATARAVQDDVDPIETRVVPGVSPRFLEAVAWMLALRPGERPQSVDALRAVLDGTESVPTPRRGITLPAVAAPPAVIAAFAPTQFAAPTATPMHDAKTQLIDVGGRSAPPEPTVRDVAPHDPTLNPPMASSASVALAEAPTSWPDVAVPSAPEAASATDAAASDAPVPRVGRAARWSMPLAGLTIAVLLAVIVGLGHALWEAAGGRAAEQRAAAASAAASGMASASAVARTAATAIAPAAVGSGASQAAIMPGGLAASAPSLAAASGTVAAPSAPPASSVSMMAAARAPARPQAADRVASTAVAGAVGAAGATSAASQARAGLRPAATPRTEARPPDLGTQVAGPERNSTPTSTGSAAVEPVPALRQSSGDSTSARDACGDRVFIALALCIERRCQEPRFRNTRECVSVLEARRLREDR